MNKFLIVNADDFGYSYSINKGIIEAHNKGVVTSTSVLIDGIAAHEAAHLRNYLELSIGLHLELANILNIEAELLRQIEKFVSIVGKMPDHIDTHKRNTTDHIIKEALEAYSQVTKIPVRNFNAKHIDSYGINSNDTSVTRLKKSINEATDTYNELMTHCGYSDKYLREHSSYSDLREQELEAINDPEIRKYILFKRLNLCNWQRVPVKL